MSNRRLRSNVATAGFSIIELLAVLAIVATALALVTPRFARTANASGLRATAYELAVSARAARAMSIAANHDVAFVLDLQSMTYATPPRPPIVLPRDITLSFERAQDVLRGPADARLIFYPSGGSSGGRILLSSAQGRVSVTVDWLTGSVAVTQEPL